MLWWTLRQLKSANAATRSKAAATLGVGGNTAAIPALAAAVKDQDTAVRVAALDALGAIGDASAVEAIVGAVRESDAGRTPDEATGIRAAASRAFGRLGSGARAPLLVAAGDRNARVREAAVSALGSIRGAEAEQALLEALADDRSAIRQAAALSLAGTAGERAAGPLARALNHRDAQTRRCATEALGTIGGEEATSALAIAARDKDQAVRDAAVHALGRIGTRPAVSVLLAVYRGLDRDDRLAAGAALKQARWEPADAGERVAHAIVHGDYQAAAREGGVAVAMLAATFSDRDPGARRAAAAALGNVAEASAAPPLVAALDERAATVRHAAREALSGMQEVPGVASRLAGALTAGHQADDGDAGRVHIVDPDPVERARRAFEELNRVLQHAADHVPDAELRALAGLPDLVLLEHRDSPLLAERVSCEALRAQARAELDRRTVAHRSP